MKYLNLYLTAACIFMAVGTWNAVVSDSLYYALAVLNFGLFLDKEE